MEEKKIIVDIQVPDDQVVKATEAIAANTKTLEELRAANKALAADVGKTDKAYINNAATIKRLSAETRQHERTLIASQKAVKANNGSIVAMREQLSAATAAYNNLSKEERNNVEIGGRLQKQTKSLSDELKRLEGAVGNNTRNVGNYSEGFREAVSAQNGMVGSSLKLFNTLKANPFILIITLLTSLGQKIFATQGFIDTFNSVVVPLNTVLERFIGILQRLITEGFDKLKRAIKEPKQALIEFGTVVTSLLKSIVTRDFSAFTNALKGAFNSVKDEITGAFDEGKRLAELTKEINRQRANLEVIESNLTSAYQKQEEAARNTTLTAQARTDAANRAFEIEQQRLAEQLKLKDLLIEEAQLKAAQNDTDDLAQIALNKLIGERERLIEQSNRKTSQLRNQVAAISKADAEAQKRAREQELREVETLANDRLRLERETQKQIEQAAKQRLDNELKAAENQITLITNELKAAYINGELSEQAYQDQLTAIVTGAEATRKAVIEQFSLTDQENQIVSLEFATEIERRREEMLLSSESRILQAKVAAKDEEIAKARQAAEIEIALQEQRKAATIQATQQILGNLQGALEEGSAAAKAAAVFQALINAFASYNAALVQPLPFPLPQILAATNLASGLAQVAKMKQETPKFADGVIGIAGPGTGTSDSIDAKISRGESVITAKATSAFAPVLAEMERKVGNKPNTSYSRGRFASGVIGASGLAANFSGIGQAQKEVEAFKNIQIVTRITDIDRINQRREIASRVTDIE